MAPSTYADVLAGNLRAARSRIGIGQEALAERMRNLGYEAWIRQTVGSTERGRRRPTAEEVFGLAVALETTIAALMSATDQDGAVEFPNGRAIHSTSVERLAGRGVNDHAVQWPDHGNSPVFFRYTERPTRDPFDREAFGPAMTAQGWPEGPQAQPIVAAIVTADRKVLIGKRRDGKPPWTFIAGEQRLTESMATTASREVKEEAGGLLVEVGDKLGERVHPKTGRTMVYMAAAPTHGTDIDVGDRDELAEVKWATLAEADERMPDMYEPVRAYLEHVIGEAGKT